MGGGGTADGFLFPRIDHALEIEIALFRFAFVYAHPFDGAAVHTHQQLPVLQDAKVFANGDLRNAKIFTKRRYIHA